ncbi:MAG: NAD-dependent epimerase/dehydratase family protein [Pseudarcicella sp.]|nr:NAD-dependent epimerase/dehydratase family protein [Pseudarcicella sp.]
MSVLITGSNGFLGRFICQYYDEIDVDYVTLSRKNANINVDLSKNVPDIPFVNMVIHSAGLAHFVPKSEDEIESFFSNNVKGTQNLLKSLESNLSLKSFIFISSVSVYGCNSGDSISESHPLNASDPYGKSKIEAELMIKKWCEDRSIICGILRLPLLVGENPIGNLGSMVSALNKRYYFNIGGGKAKKSMVLAKDVVKVFSKLSKQGGTFNLTDGLHPDFKELSETISKKKQLNLPLNLAKCIAKFGDILGDKFPLNTSRLNKITSNLIFNDDLAKINLNWNPESVVQYLKENKI